MKRERFVFLSRFATALALAAAAPALGQVTPLPATQVPLAGASVPKFVDPLPVLSLDPAVPGVQVALGTTVADATMPGGFRQDLTLNMCEFANNVLSTGTPLAVGATGASHVWGYRVGAEGICPGQDSLVADSYIGPVVVAQRGIPTRITYVNRLGESAATKVLAYKESTDLTLMWADPLNTSSVAPTAPLENPWVAAVPPEANFCAAYAEANPDAPPLAICNDHYVGPIPAAPHLHGGEIPAVLDGGPDAWWTQSGIYGHGYYSLNGFADSGAGKAVYTYPNTQEAAPLWFHDHVLGATRLNVYAGIAGAYMITDGDPLAQSLAMPAGLLPLGLDTNGNGTTDVGVDPVSGLAYDELLVPLVLQDRMFDQNGELFFPASGFATSIEHPYWVPEFVGDTIVVNGKTWPYLNVQPKRYRFLILNGSNARAYELTLVRSGVAGKFGPPMWVIGNDQGYLDRPVKILAGADPAVVAASQYANVLTIMPGERYEVIIDFAGKEGLTFEMRNSAAIPYPFGGPVTPGLDDTILQIRVGAALPGFVDSGYDPNPRTGGGAPLRSPMVRLVAPKTGTVVNGLTINQVRRLTLNEYISAATGAPAEVMMNNTDYRGQKNLSGVPYPRFTEYQQVTTRWNTSYYSELPNEGETEIWEFVNFTADAHPIHPHLVAFQILNREPFDAVAYQGVYDSLFPSGVYEPGAGPPLDYNCGLGLLAQGRGKIFVPGTSCVLGGNPDPLAVAPLVGAVPLPPEFHEMGWKDTAISYPGEILRLVVRFAPQGLGKGAWNGAYAFNPSDGHGYVWHCHIIDHEDNEMMRPYAVQANARAVRTFVSRQVDPVGGQY